MRKIKLDLSRLAVDSFQVPERSDMVGTVAGNEATPGCSFANSCVDSCQLSCTGSCYTGLNCHQVC